MSIRFPFHHCFSSFVYSSCFSSCFDTCLCSPHLSLSPWWLSCSRWVYVVSPEPEHRCWVEPKHETQEGLWAQLIRNLSSPQAQCVRLTKLALISHFPLCVLPLIKNPITALRKRKQTIKALQNTLRRRFPPLKPNQSAASWDSWFAISMSRRGDVDIRGRWNGIDNIKEVHSSEYHRFAPALLWVQRRDLIKLCLFNATLWSSHHKMSLFW